MAGKVQGRTTSPSADLQTLEQLRANGKYGKIATELRQAYEQKDATQYEELLKKLQENISDPKGGKKTITEQDIQALHRLATSIQQDSTKQGVETSTSGDTGTDQGHSKPEDQLPEERNLKEPDAENKVLKKLSDERSKEILQLKKDIAEKENEILEQTETVDVLKKQRETLLSNKHELETENKDLKRDLKDNKDEAERKTNELKAQLKSANEEMKKMDRNFQSERKKMAADYEKRLQDAEEERKTKLEEMSKEYQANAEQIIQRRLEEARKMHNKEIWKLKDNMKEVKAERDDLKTRFSKLAGAKLTDQNADIADLSDPNRALKLSERFGQLYDDEWTDAFEYLKKTKKMSVQPAITLLLQMLKDCLEYCSGLSEAQIDSLENVLLHPYQDVSTYSSQGKTDAKQLPKIRSTDHSAVSDVRRKIGVYDSVINEVKRRFVTETKQWEAKTGYDKTIIEACSPYLQKSVEVCWLMVIHCPPLYVQLDVQKGDPLDLNYFTNYITQSRRIEYLVWPPLFNEKQGGLLKKGVAEGMKESKK